MMSAYRFVSVWKFAAPIERVWKALNSPDTYPRWWPSMRSYRDLTPGVVGVGARSERVVKGRLPYQLRYTTTITRSDAPRELAYDATGDLVGDGRFLLEEKDGGTVVTFYWNVQTTHWWMNAFAFLLRPLLSWNHTQVMAEGERGLAKWLEESAVATPK
jgi:uncharacterized protein YndB with AHSA1/START domain